MQTEHAILPKEKQNQQILRANEHKDSSLATKFEGREKKLMRDFIKEIETEHALSIFNLFGCGWDR